MILDLITPQPKLYPYNNKRIIPYHLYLYNFQQRVRLNIIISIIQTPLAPQQHVIFIGLYSTKSIRSVITGKDTEEIKFYEGNCIFSILTSWS